MSEAESHWACVEADADLIRIHDALDSEADRYNNSSAYEHQVSRERLIELRDEVDEELQRRADERNAPTYCGPGYYTDQRSGTTLHVVGRVIIDGTPRLLIGQSLDDQALWALLADKIEGRVNGRRIFEYSAVES
jgi:hypothetical protein